VSTLIVGDICWWPDVIKYPLGVVINDTGYKRICEFGIGTSIVRRETLREYYESYVKVAHIVDFSAKLFELPEYSTWLDRAVPQDYADLPNRHLFLEVLSSGVKLNAFIGLKIQNMSHLVFALSKPNEPRRVSIGSKVIDLGSIDIFINVLKERQEKE